MSAATSSRVDELPAQYREMVGSSTERPLSAAPSASVVIVTYGTPRAVLRETLDALDEQTADDFEVIVVDNGVRFDLDELVERTERVSALVHLDGNYGVTVARNVGAEVAASDLLIFLDDDGIPDGDFVAAHRAAHDDGAVAVRGRVLPRSDSLYNRLQTWYDLGDERVPFTLNIEGNASIRRAAFREVSGFDESLSGRAGHEGIELTYRLLTSGYDREDIVYDPRPVIYHDYATDVRSYLRKRAAGRRRRRLLAATRPEVSKLAREYSKPTSSRSDRARGDRFALVCLDAMVRLTLAFTSLRKKVNLPGGRAGGGRA
ncbi:glycosyltransferase family 2 protein [Halopelagius longus]|uniref:Glycosyltransferase n=1 Tax=Halopelagius longus TaxID=1236180 RepID=A0A1H1GN54_9EURY|nr:glycosyltransferase [Halopelagius longus]RDI69648.1 glycosyltransferase [Halopelagius longus]SDR14513.1 Glycosyltransferase, GT2 family [Halopelagius longus]